MKFYVPTQQEIDERVAIAELGSADSLAWLNEINQKMASRANQRLRTFEKEGLQSPAVSMANDYLSEVGRTRFSESKKFNFENLSALEENLEETGKFLRAQTSSIRGEEKRRRNIYRGLANAGWISLPDEDTEEYREFRTGMDAFFESDAWEEIKGTIGTPTIQKASELIESGKRTVEQLESLFKEWQHGTQYDITHVWDGWVKGAGSLEEVAAERTKRRNKRNTI